MAFEYGFYNSINGDRKYNAIHMGQIFDGIINDGVFLSIGEKFTTLVTTGMDITVGTGKAWFNHTWNLNTTKMPFTISPSHVVLARYDAVVLEVNDAPDVYGRVNTIKVIEGTPSSNAVKPALINTDNIHQYPLSYIKINPGVTALTAADIEIMVGQDPCPYVTGILQTTDISELFANWESQFNTWFDNLKAQLTGDIVSNLQNQIDNCIKVTDIATGADIAAGTAGKVVDAAKFKTVEYKVGDTLTTWRTDLGENWLLCNGDEFDPEEYPELASISDFPIETAVMDSHFNTFVYAYKNGNNFNDYLKFLISGSYLHSGRRHIMLVSGTGRTSTANPTYTLHVYDIVSKTYSLENISAADNRFHFFISPLVRYLDGADLFIKLAETTRLGIFPEMYDDTTKETTKTIPNMYSTMGYQAIYDNNKIYIVTFYISSYPTYNICTCDITGDNAVLNSYDLTQIFPNASWNGTNIFVGSAVYKKKILLFINNPYFYSDKDIIGGQKYEAFAICVIDPLHPTEITPPKVIYIRSDINAKFRVSSGNSVNRNVKYTNGMGEILVSFGCAYNGKSTFSYRNLIIRDLEDLPDEIVFDFVGGKYDYGVKINGDAYWVSNNFSSIKRYKDKYIGGVTFTNNESSMWQAAKLRVLSDPDDASTIETIDAFPISNLNSLTFMEYITGTLFPTFAVGKSTLYILNHYILNENNGSVCAIELPEYYLPYKTDGLYTYIKAKEDTPNANQQTDTPAS